MTTMLIAEDDPTISSMLEHYAIAQDFYPLLARNGCEALSLARSTRPDIIVVDLMMPCMTGSEVAMQLRKHQDTALIPIIVVTAMNNPAEIADVIQVDRILTKPFDIDLLHREIVELLQNQKHLNEQK